MTFSMTKDNNILEQFTGEDCSFPAQDEQNDTSLENLTASASLSTLQYQLESDNDSIEIINSLLFGDETKQIETILCPAVRDKLAASKHFHQQHAIHLTKLIASNESQSVDERWSSFEEVNPTPCKSKQNNKSGLRVQFAMIEIPPTKRGRDDTACDIMELRRKERARLDHLAQLETSDSNKWECRQCKNSNSDTMSRCPACHTPRPWVAFLAPLFRTWFGFNILDNSMSKRKESNRSKHQPHEVMKDHEQKEKTSCSARSTERRGQASFVRHMGCNRHARTKISRPNECLTNITQL